MSYEQEWLALAEVLGIEGHTSPAKMVEMVKSIVVAAARELESDMTAAEVGQMKARDLSLERCCPCHGPLAGVRYCPECASVGQPWTEDQADAASVRSALQRASARIADRIDLTAPCPDDAVYAHAISLVLEGLR